MTIYAKVSNAWKHTRRVFTKISGAWKRVNAAYVKQGGVWKQVYGNNEFIVYSLGLGQTVYPMNTAGIWKNGVQFHTLDANWNAYLGQSGLWNGEPWPPANQTNTPVKRSLNLVLFDKYGNIDKNTVYGDTYPTPQDASVPNLQSVVNALPVGQRFILYGFDIPGYHPEWGGPIVSALGGDATDFNNASIPPHCAYVLIGKKGQSIFWQGHAGDAEPDSSGSANGAIRLKFGIQDGEFVSLPG